MPSLAFASLFTAAIALVVRQSGPVDPSTSPDCTYYTDWPVEYLDQGETCASIASFWGISERAFKIWNPSVGSDCSNLIEGNSYCVEENGSTADPPAATTSLSSSLTSSRATTTSASSSSTGPSSTSASDPSKPSPTQGGLAADCQRFYQVQSGDFCQAIVDQYGTFTLDDFYSWNPSVGSTCGGLQAGYYVCVGVTGTPTTRPSSTVPPATPTPTTNGPQPQQSGITKDCQNFYLVQQGDFCQAIVEQYGTFSLSQFYDWNPAVGNSCGGLQAGYYVCVGVTGTPTTRPSSTTPSATPSPTGNGPQPQQPGIVQECQRYYLVEQGDFCQAIVDKYGTFSLSQFYSWNPAVGSNCGGLQAGYYVCVGVAGTPTQRPTTTRATSTTQTGRPTPTPIQSGTPSNCSRYGQANQGGTCSAFAQRFGISLANLYRWNPVLGNNGQNCQTNFWAGYYYCVGV